MRTPEQKQREQAMLRTSKSSYKRLKKNTVLFHEMRNETVREIVRSKPSYDIRLTVTKHGV